MKRTLSIIAALIILCCRASATEKPSGDSLTTKPYRYQGTLSFGYICRDLGFGVKTTHGVLYDKSRIFVGGEVWYRYGIIDGNMGKVGATFRWSFLSHRWVDMYLGCGGGLFINRKSGPTPTWTEHRDFFNIGLYVSPELGIGIGVGNGHYIDISVDLPLNYIFYQKKYIKSYEDGAEFRDSGMCFQYVPYISPGIGINIGYRFRF